MTKLLAIYFVSENKLKVYLNRKVKGFLKIKKIKKKPQTYI